MNKKGLAGIEGIFTSGAAIITALIGLIGYMLHIPEIAVLAAIFLLVIINAIVHLPVWFIVVAVILILSFILRRNK